MMRRALDFCIDTPLVPFIVAGLVVLAGLIVMPFPSGIDRLPRAPVPVDAIPDIGENQQIVITQWPGRSPQDVEDQITYPLSRALQGGAGVQSIRTQSAFGRSMIYIVFRDGVDFYWSRARLLEKLSALPPGLLPPDVRPGLGPEATALGQVFWYVLSGEGFDLHELRTIQDYQVRLALQAVEGVAEVASVGGHVREYQVEVDPASLDVYGVTLDQVVTAVRESNLDVGAGTLELNGVEYLLRGSGAVRALDALPDALVAAPGGVPIRLGQVARVVAGPADRRGVLDRGGEEVVGGVVVVQYGANPLVTISGIHQRIVELTPSLPQRALPDGRLSRVTIEPFYDRTGLIEETLGTLSEALINQILVTILVVVLLIWQLRVAMLVSLVLPLGVLLTFCGMWIVGVEAHVMSLGGIAIAIGTMVDLGIILTENTVRHLEEAPPERPTREVVREATHEVAGAVVVAVSTTVVSFLPVFSMVGREGKLFVPLAWTKTLALVAAVVVALVVVPGWAAVALRREAAPRIVRRALAGAVLGVAVLLAVYDRWGLAMAALGLGALRWLHGRWSPAGQARANRAVLVAAAAAVIVALAYAWRPLGPGPGVTAQVVVVAALGLGVVGAIRLFLHGFVPLLRWALDHKLLFSLLPLSLLAAGGLAWRGASPLLDAAPDRVRSSRLAQNLEGLFPGLRTAFMPPFDEGSFLLMPTTMPHASLAEAVAILQQQDPAIAAIPEVTSVVGKIGRVESALDPAPLSMIETVINYLPEYGPPDPETGERPRQWRPHLRTLDDLWNEIAETAHVPGTTLAPPLQPIAARLVMLQSGLRAPMAIKVRGARLEDIAEAVQAIEPVMQAVDGVRRGTVVADRPLGKPYLEINPRREALQRYGLTMAEAMRLVEQGVGGVAVGVSLEGRERVPIRVRLTREDRLDPEAIGALRVNTPAGQRVPISQIADLEVRAGPTMIRGEDGFLVGYVLFDRAPDQDAAQLVARAQTALERAVRDGDLTLPSGVTWAFTGDFENQLRAERTLALAIPVGLVLIFLILYMQFRSVATSLFIFSGVAVAWSGGFLALWLWGHGDWFDWGFADVTVRDALHMGPIELSVAVWVGFLALFGVATDDGVVMSTYLTQRFAAQPPTSVAEVRAATVDAASRRVRACLLTTGTTVLALLPVVTSAGRGADVMRPMALPTIGGMAVEVLTLFVVPVCWSAWHERRLGAAFAVTKSNGTV